jgi:hypothetical protein
MAVCGEAKNIISTGAERGARALLAFLSEACESPVEQMFLAALADSWGLKSILIFDDPSAGFRVWGRRSTSYSLFTAVRIAASRASTSKMDAVVISA